ncbi:MAG: ABC transporter C-terminal domain-containing protein [Planctomycetota bacterium]
MCIASAEAELAALDRALGDPELYSKPAAELRALMQRRETVQASIAQLYQRWEELEALGSS